MELYSLWSRKSSNLKIFGTEAFNTKLLNFMLLLTLKQKAKSKPKKMVFAQSFKQRKFMYCIGNSNTIKCMNYSLNLKA